MDYLATYKFYLPTGERLSIFGRVKGNTLNIKVYPCNKKDQFKKKMMREDFLSPTPSYKASTYNIELDGVNSPKYLFMQFCKEMFFKIKEEFLSVKSNHILSLEINKGGGKLSKMYQNIHVKYLSK